MTAVSRAQIECLLGALKDEIDAVLSHAQGAAALRDALAREIALENAADDAACREDD